MLEPKHAEFLPKLKLQISYQL